MVLFTANRSGQLPHTYLLPSAISRSCRLRYCQHGMTVGVAGNALSMWMSALDPDAVSDARTGPMLDFACSSRNGWSFALHSVFSGIASHDSCFDLNLVCSDSLVVKHQTAHLETQVRFLGCCTPTQGINWGAYQMHTCAQEGR